MRQAGRKEVHGGGESEQEPSLPHQLAETLRHDFPVKEGARAVIERVDDRVDAQADDGHAAAHQPTDREERQTANRARGQRGKPARADEDSATQANDEDHNRNRHTRIVADASDDLTMQIAWRVIPAVLAAGRGQAVRE
jgi:hypothetical protein